MALVKTVVAPRLVQYSFVVGFAELNAAATTQAIVLKVMGDEDMQVVGSSWELIIPFADAGSISAVGVTVGDGSDVDAYGAIADVFTTAGTYAGAGAALGTKAAGVSLTATFTATGANFGDGATSDLDAGSVCFTVLVLRHLKVS